MCFASPQLRYASSYCRIKLCIECSVPMSYNSLIGNNRIGTICKKGHSIVPRVFFCFGGIICKRDHLIVPQGPFLLEDVVKGVSK